MNMKNSVAIIDSPVLKTISMTNARYAQVQSMIISGKRKENSISKMELLLPLAPHMSV